MGILWYYLGIGVVIELITLFLLFIVAPRITWELGDLPEIDRVEEAQNIIISHPIAHILFIVVLWPRFLYRVIRG